jgi:hypothetical protein
MILCTYLNYSMKDQELVMMSSLQYQKKYFHNLFILINSSINKVHEELYYSAEHLLNMDLSIYNNIT